jgi:hypothetical protein
VGPFFSPHLPDHPGFKGFASNREKFGMGFFVFPPFAAETFLPRIFPVWLGTKLSIGFNLEKKSEPRYWF